MRHRLAHGIEPRLASRVTLAIAVILWSVISACSDRGMLTAVRPPTSPNENIQLTDWFSCWKFEGDANWRECEYTGTTATDNGASMAYFTNPVYYTSLQQVGVTQNPNAVEPAPQPYAPQFDLSDTVQQSAIPNCNYMEDLDLRNKAWCNGKDPADASSGDRHRLKVIQNALAKMTALGPPCDRFASEMSQVLGSHHLRVYHPNPDPSVPGYKKGGFASIGAGGGGYVLLSDVWVDSYYDEYKYIVVWTKVNGVATRVNVDLQFALS